VPCDRSRVAAQWVQQVRRNTNRTRDVKGTLNGGLVLCVTVATMATAQAADSTTQKTFFVARDGIYALTALAVSTGLSAFDARIEHNF
jgi:hypothetical protein